MMRSDLALYLVTGVFLILLVLLTHWRWSRSKTAPATPGGILGDIVAEEIPGDLVDADAPPEELRDTPLRSLTPSDQPDPAKNGRSNRLPPRPDKRAVETPTPTPDKIIIDTPPPPPEYVEKGENAPKSMAKTCLNRPRGGEAVEGAVHGSARPAARRRGDSGGHWDARQYRHGYREGNDAGVLPKALAEQRGAWRD